MRPSKLEFVQPIEEISQHTQRDQTNQLTQASHRELPRIQESLRNFSKLEMYSVNDALWPLLKKSCTLTSTTQKNLFCRVRRTAEMCEGKPTSSSSPIGLLCKMLQLRWHFYNSCHVDYRQQQFKPVYIVTI